MSKKRTKRQKLEARHQFQISWRPTQDIAKRTATSFDVNSQTNEAKNKLFTEKSSKKTASISDKTYGPASIRADLVKSLILAAFILASEVVLYLNWTKILSIGFGF